HRDLKPANVFLTRDEEGQLLVKLLDFGIARAIHAHRLSSAFSTAKGLVFGTPSYMSPEQARASAKLDQRCDLWALATIAYEAIAGELPIAGSDTDELLKNLCAGRIIPLRERTTQGPPALDAFFRRAFSDAIGARYQTATALAQAFEAAAAPRVDDEALDVPPPSESSAPSNVEVEIDVAALQRRGRARLALVAAGALLVLFAAVGAAWRVLAGPSVAPAASTVRTAAVAASVPGTPGIPSIPSIPSVTLTEPSVPVSALPQAPARPPPAGRGPHDPSPTPPPSPSAPGTVAGPLVAPAPAPPPPPAPAPAPTASKKVDRSEVF
ncbi:MAG TPA: protein kinase, partial [Polyangiaceae bacterium]